MDVVGRFLEALEERVGGLDVEALRFDHDPHAMVDRERLEARSAMSSAICSMRMNSPSRSITTRSGCDAAGQPVALVAGPAAAAGGYQVSAELEREAPLAQALGARPADRRGPPRAPARRPCRPWPAPVRGCQRTSVRPRRACAGADRGAIAAGRAEPRVAACRCARRRARRQAASAASVARSTSAATAAAGRSPSSATMRSRVAARELVVALGDARLQRQALGLEAIGRPAGDGRPPARGRPCSSTVRSAIRPPVARSLTCQHGLDPQAAGEALVGKRRVDVAVEHHDEAARRARAARASATSWARAAA